LIYRIQKNGEKARSLLHESVKIVLSEENSKLKSLKWFLDAQKDL
jgi:hypothetical protein